MLGWIEANGAWLGWVAALSVATVLLTLVAIPFVVARIPVDYFCHRRREPLYLRYGHPLIGMLVVGAKNLLGALLIVLGIVMIFTPGQGLLTMFLGVMLLNFPGKYQLEMWLVEQPKVLSTINWMRAKLDRPPLETPEHMRPAEELGDA